MGINDNESGDGQRAAAKSLFGFDFSLRLVLFAASVSAIVLLVTSKQTATFPVATGFPAQPFVTVTRDSKFQYAPAFIYLLVALSLAGLYSIITMVASISKTSPSTKTLFNLIIFDLLVAGVMASAMGSAGSIAYTGLKGNSHANWSKICNIFDKYCRHVAASFALSLIASVALVLLVIVSSYSLYRRSR